MKEGIPISTLSPDKQAAVRNIALFAKYGSAVGFLPQYLSWAKEIKR